MAEIHVVPSSSDSQLVSSYYFYSDYDPTEHFEYKRVFDKSNNEKQEETMENKRQAFAKVVEYHFSFEQILPTESTDGSGDFITFFRPKMNSSLLDFEFGAKNKYVTMTESEFKASYTAYLEKLPTKSVMFSDRMENGEIKQGIATARYMGDVDYRNMSIDDLEQLYDTWSSQTGYTDATRINQHCYDCALYCKIERPRKYGSSKYVSPYDFRKILRSVNQIFKFKLPVEEGWYMYNKYKKQWEIIEFQEATS